MMLSTPALSEISNFKFQTKARGARRRLFTSSNVWKFLEPNKAINHKAVNNSPITCSTPHGSAFHDDSTM